MTKKDAVMEFIELSRQHTNDGLMDNSLKSRIKKSFDEIMSSIVKEYRDDLIPKLIICRTYNKYGCVLPVKKIQDKYDYYLLYDQHLNDINYFFNAFFLSDTDIEHDIWKLSYELFAEEALLSNKKLLVTYYGFNKVALGPFNILKYEFKELDFISEVQEKYILAHEFGHWIFHIKKSNNTLSILNLKNNLSDLMEEIKAMLSEIYNQYGKIFQDKDYLKVISEQNNIVENNDDIIEECFADAVAYAFVFSYISSEYPDNLEMKLLAGKALFLEILNLQILSMHHMTVSDETFENSVSIRVSFFRNYVGLYFEDEYELFNKMLEQDILRYEDRITNPILDCFNVLEERENFIYGALLQDDGELNLDKVVGIFDSYDN